MLTEHFVASVGTPSKSAPSNTAIKDAAIFIHEYQPLNAQKSIFKKSVTPPNCLAVSETKIFAAQAEKAVVHVYNRDKGNQEAIVPFTERITCIALACDDSVLVLGTAEGKVFLWEVASGRQITTAQAHLQAVTGLKVDAGSNFLLSASEDSSVHVWSLPALLSFTGAGSDGPLSPISTFGSHRSKVAALTIGHGRSACNFAVSAAVDGACFVWDYRTNDVLRTYLLSAVPTCVELDATDRAVYVGYEDGSVQQLDLYSQQTGNADIGAPIQPPPSLKWTTPDKSAGAILCLSVSFDGTTIISGHDSGTILFWEVARNGSPTALLQFPLPGPVTNLAFLPVNGFPDQRHKYIKIPAVVKPKFGAFDSANGTVPINYSVQVQLTGQAGNRNKSEFEEALTALSFPQNMIDQGLNELLTWNTKPQANGGDSGLTDDFMALDDEPEQPHQLSLTEQNTALKAELEALRRVQKASFEKLEKVNSERTALLLREQKRLQKSATSGANSLPNGKVSTVGGDIDLSSDGD